MKKVVVTGSGKGIGFAIAKKFAGAGHAVFMCARNGADLEKSAKIIREQTGNNNVFSHICDVSKKDELKHFFEKVDMEFGAIDVLVNNAGIFLPGQIYNEADGVIEQLTQTNLYSAYYLTRFFLPKMMAHKSGHIFNICSTASITAYPNGGSYCITKFALYGFSKELREEMKPHNIKVTSVLPGATFTSSWQNSGLPEERFMSADDVADAVYMCSNLSPSAVIEEILMRPQAGDIE